MCALPISPSSRNIWWTFFLASPNTFEESAPLRHGLSAEKNSLINYIQILVIINSHAVLPHGTWTREKTGMVENKVDLRSIVCCDKATA
jgi:hypothetical protein